MNYAQESLRCMQTTRSDHFSITGQRQSLAAAVVCTTSGELEFHLRLLEAYTLQRAWQSWRSGWQRLASHQSQRCLAEPGQCSRVPPDDGQTECATPVLAERIHVRNRYPKGRYFTAPFRPRFASLDSTLEAGAEPSQPRLGTHPPNQP